MQRIPAGAAMFRRVHPRSFPTNANRQHHVLVKLEIFRERKDRLIDNLLSPMCWESIPFRVGPAVHD